MAKAAAELEVTVNTYRAHQDAEQQLAEAVRYLKEEAASDPDMAEFAREEIRELEAQVCLEGRGASPPAGCEPARRGPRVCWLRGIAGRSQGCWGREEGAFYDKSGTCKDAAEAARCCLCWATGVHTSLACTPRTAPPLRTQLFPGRNLRYAPPALKIADLEKQLSLLLLPRDPLDDKDIMLEIRAGAGGDEAGIWAGDLLRMYQRYAQAQVRGDQLVPKCGLEAVGGASRAQVAEQPPLVVRSVHRWFTITVEPCGPRAFLAIVLTRQRCVSSTQGWKASMISSTVAEAGGYKEAILQVGAG